MPGVASSLLGVLFVGCDEAADPEPLPFGVDWMGEVEEVPGSDSLFVGPRFVVGAEGSFFVLGGDGEPADRFVREPGGFLVGDFYTASKNRTNHPEH